MAGAASDEVEPAAAPLVASVSGAAGPEPAAGRGGAGCGVVGRFGVVGRAGDGTVGRVGAGRVGAGGAGAVAAAAGAVADAAWAVADAAGAIADAAGAVADAAGVSPAAVSGVDDFAATVVRSR